MKQRLTTLWAAACLAMAVTFGVATVLEGAGCGSQQHHVAVASITTLGTIVAGLSDENRAIYQRESDAAMQRVRAQAGGTLADARAENATREAKFLERSRVINALNAHLFSAAAIIDAAEAGHNMQLYALAAQKLIEAIQASVAVLRDGSVLPAVTVPPQVDTVLASLAVIARGVANG